MQKAGDIPQIADTVKFAILGKDPRLNRQRKRLCFKAGPTENLPPAAKAHFIFSYLRHD
jgi:hypothetical protein